MEQSSVCRLSDPRSCSPAVSGGKGSKLAELTRLRFNVPPGFVITPDTFQSLFHADYRFVARWKQLLSNSSVCDPLHLAREAQSLRDLVADIVIPASLIQEWLDEFDQLGTASVAVRSSGGMEDGRQQSFAGQFDSYLSIGRSELVDAVRRCWASAFTARSIAYRAALPNASTTSVDFAVVIQAMIPATAAGVAFTEHPVSRDPQQLYIEAVWGLGETLVGGDVSPDTYLINKHDGRLVQTDRGGQRRMKTCTATAGIQWVDLTPPLLDTEKLAPRVLFELTQICLELERIEARALDIEWAVTNTEIHVLQCRSMTR